MVNYDIETKAIENIEFEWAFLEVLRDYLTDVDITETKLIEVRAELVKLHAGVSTDGYKGYTELLDEEDRLQNILTSKYSRARRTLYTLNEMNSTSSRFILDFLLTPGLSVNRLSKMYNLHREETARILRNYNNYLQKGDIRQLKKMIDKFEEKQDLN